MKKMYTLCVLVHLHFMQQILLKLVSMNVHSKSCQVNLMLVYRALIKPLSCMNCRLKFSKMADNPKHYWVAETELLIKSMILT